MFVDPSQGGSLVLQNRGLVLAGTILILRTQMLPNLHQYSHNCMSQLLLKLLSTASSHLALRLNLKKKKKKKKRSVSILILAQASMVVKLLVLKPDLQKAGAWE